MTSASNENGDLFRSKPEQEQPDRVETVRGLEFTRQYKDYKRVSRGRYSKTVQSDLRSIITLLLADEALPANLQDHTLTGDWTGHRDCHVRPDLVLIYRYPDNSTLQLVRLGSHSELKF